MRTRTATLAPSPELAAARDKWSDPFTDTGFENLAALTVAAPVGTVLAGEWFPELTVAEHGEGWCRLTGDGRPAQPGTWCTCQPPPGDWLYYETWSAQRRTAHGWVHAGCRRLIQSG